MGKRSRRGASLRATRRANVANQELEFALADLDEGTRLSSAADADLFVLDTARVGGVGGGGGGGGGVVVAGGSRVGGGGSGGRRRREITEEEMTMMDKGKRRSMKLVHSEREERQIRRLIRLHGREGTLALAEAGRARTVVGTRLTSMGVHATTNPPFDLWGGDTTTTTTSTTTTTTTGTDPVAAVAVVPSSATATNCPGGGASDSAVLLPSSSHPPRLAVEVAHPGQSYRPDFEHHQDAIGMALSIEIRRNEAVEYKQTPLSDGMSAHVREYMVDDTEDDDDDDDDDDTDDDAGEGGAMNAVVKSSKTTSMPVRKRKEKLTRAQRNRQRRVKAEHVEIRERRARRALLHQANEARSLGIAVRREEEEAARRRDEVNRLRAERLSRPLGTDVWVALSRTDPISAPALPVALTEELMGNAEIGGGRGGGVGGSLRTIVPKGSIVTDRVESMAARNMIIKKKASEGRRIVQGKKRNNKVRGPEGGTEYMLM